jgi:hypothetical protein
MSSHTAQPGRSLIIKGLCPGLTERGKIKIGRKGKTVTSQRGTNFQPPEKLDHFLITTMQRGNDGNFLPDGAIMQRIAQATGQQATAIKSIPVRLLYNDVALNFQCRYACFAGKNLWCSGDGEAAHRLNQQGQRDVVTCPCGRQDPNYQGQDKCKINGCLSVMIDGVDVVGGVWKLRTTSYNTVVGILSSLALIQRISGGPLAGLPLNLTLHPKTVVAPNGAVQTVYIAGLEYRGSAQQLQDTGYKLALNDAQHHARIEYIETEARKLLTTELPADEYDEVVDEYYPEQAAAAAGVEYVDPSQPPALVQPETERQPATRADNPQQPAAPSLDPPAEHKPARRGRPSKETTAAEPVAANPEVVAEAPPEPPEHIPPPQEEPPATTRRKASLDLF